MVLLLVTLALILSPLSPHKMKQLKILLLALVLVATTIAPLGIAPLSGADDLVDAELGVAVGETVAADVINVEAVTEAVHQSTLLLQLKQKLAKAKYRYFLLQSNLEQAKEGLSEVREMVAHLEAELGNLDGLIEDTDRQILSVKTQQERKSMELADLEEEVQILELQFEDQKDLVGELMTLLYVKRGIYYEAGGVDAGSVNPVKVLAGPDSVSETLQQMTYLDLMEGEVHAQMDRMTELSEELSGKWDEIRVKKDELDKLDAKLAMDSERLAGEFAVQMRLLEETQDEEMLYEEMLGTADEREEDLAWEIELYEENVAELEAQLAGTRELLTEAQQDLIGQIQDEMAAEFGVDAAADFLELDWPVSPRSGLTAYYIDDGYVATFGMQHYALDVRAQHGSEIFAPADGVVSDIVFDGDSIGYAYVRLAHRKGVMTVYGHVSEVAVNVGDYVRRGEVIGFSGGTPGTVGAGVRTTGPHLHFEVWQDGVRVDPLLYLPLEEVPADYLPEDYRAEVQGELEAELKEISEALGF